MCFVETNDVFVETNYVFVETNDERRHKLQTFALLCWATLGWFVFRLSTSRWKTCIYAVGLLMQYRENGKRRLGSGRSAGLIPRGMF